MLKFYEDKDIVIDDIHNNYPYTYLVLNPFKTLFFSEKYGIKTNRPKYDKIAITFPESTSL